MEVIMSLTRSCCVLCFAMFACNASPETTSASSALRGAMFTTTADGTRVDANVYTAKTDVYINGGPLAHASAAALPNGDYYFQVTDPPGKVLLSEDDISCRRVRIEGGLIVATFRGNGGCEHVTGTDTTDGGLTVQLMPYADTPNPGGEYKAWITPVAAFHGSVVHS